MREKFVWNCSLILKFHLLIRKATDKIRRKNRKSKSVYWTTIEKPRAPRDVTSMGLGREKWVEKEKNRERDG